MARAVAVVVFTLLAIPIFAGAVFDEQARGANPVTAENDRPGSKRWQLSKTASKDLAGYASATSVAAGETIRFHIDANGDTTLQLEVFRMGWYQGLGGRSMHGPVEVAGKDEFIPQPDPTTGMIVCRWDPTYSLTIPAGWLSGVYLMKVVGKPSTHESYMIFVVRDDRRAELLFQSSVTTFQAYNNWGGKSLYPFNSTGPVAKKVSFERPYVTSTGPGEFIYRWEYNMLRWLEREGYDVTYVTNIDTHRFPNTLRRVKAFLSVGHDEYWSWEMRANVEAARDAGVHLGFFSANSVYWQVRFEDDFRTMVGHKETALATDPLAFDGNPTNDHLITTLFRNVPVNRPEEALIGVMYAASPVFNNDIVIHDASHWVFRGTGLKNGDKLRGLLGYEVDSIQNAALPPNRVRLAHSPYVTNDRDRHTGFSDMTLYTTHAGTMVFATGTIQWSWGLDDFNSEAHGVDPIPAAQTITKNVLNEMIGVKPPRKRRSVR